MHSCRRFVCEARLDLRFLLEPSASARAGGRFSPTEYLASVATNNHLGEAAVFAFWTGMHDAAPDRFFLHLHEDFKRDKCIVVVFNIISGNIAVRPLYLTRFFVRKSTVFVVLLCAIVGRAPFKLHLDVYFFFLIW
jgi:hypothetical protein